MTEIIRAEKKLEAASMDSSGTGTIDLPATTDFVLLNLSNVDSQEGTSFSNVGGVYTYSGDTKNFTISYSVSGINDETGTRSTAQHSLFINGVQQTRSIKYSYHRANGDGSDSATFSGGFELNNTDTIEVRSRIIAPQDDVDILLEQSNLYIKK